MKVAGTLCVPRPSRANGPLRTKKLFSSILFPGRADGTRSVPVTLTATCSAIAVICWPSCIAGRTTSGGWSELVELARQTRVPLVAAGDVHFHAPQPAGAGRTCSPPSPWRDRGRSGRAAVSQRRAASQTARELAARFARAAGVPGRTRRDRRALHVLARRAALRISRRAGPAGRDAAGVSGPADLGRRSRALSGRRARQGARADRARAGADRPVALRGLFSDRVGTWCASPGGAASCARGAARRPTRPSAIAWA